MPDFDYTVLPESFAKLSRPAKRALIANQILDAAALSKWSREEILALHGVGPSAMPVLEAALEREGLAFRLP